MTYDEAMARLEAITAELEAAEAISLDEYKKKATEATALIAFCRTQLTQLEQDLSSFLPQE